MQVRTSILAALASLAAVTLALPAPIQGNEVAARSFSQGKRCPASSDVEAAADDYNKRDTAAAGDDDGDDTPGAIIACNF